MESDMTEIFFERCVTEKVGTAAFADFEGLIVDDIIGGNKPRFFAAFANGGGKVVFVVGFTMTLWKSPFSGTTVIHKKKMGEIG